MEQNKEWYDNIYQWNRDNKGEATLKPQKSMYIDIWTRAIHVLNNNDFIADFGCGAGQFAELLIQSDKNFIYGVDFSSTAVNMAKERLPEETFIEGNLLDKKMFILYPYNAAILFEVLEHINDDLKVLGNIPKYTKCICSVPNFPYKSHVRHFTSIDQIKNRYGDLLDIRDIYPIEFKPGKIIYLIISYKK